MDSEARRRALAERLSAANGPLSAASLARELSVSRQIIVGDVALLRAGGLDITATPRGYLLPQSRASVTCTVLVPILLWGYTVIYRLAKKKNEKELEETLRHLDQEKSRK